MKNKKCSNKAVVNNYFNIFCNRKSQVSIFLILGIVLIVLIILFLLFSLNITPLRFFLKETKHPVPYYVEECIKFQIVDAVEILTLQGGFIYSYQPNLTTSLRVFAYSSYFNASTQSIQNTSPSISFMESEISRYIEQNIDNCIDDSHFRLNKIGLPKANTLIHSESISVNLDYSLELISGNVSFMFTDYYKTHSIPYGRMVELRDIIVADLIQYPNLLILDKFYDTDFEMIVSPYSGKDKVITIINKSTRLRNDPLEFNFAIRDWHILPMPLRFTHFFPDVTINVGSTIIMQAMCNHNCKFSDNTILFDIDKETGIIYYIPDSLDVGNYNITVIATDDIYTISKNFKLTVEP
jgi:hypothetical protein